MHERYLFNGLLFTIACIPFARRYLWGAIALSSCSSPISIYSLQYLHVVTDNVPGVNAQNFWGLWTAFFSLVAVGTFFWLGYVFLGASETRRADAPSRARARSRCSGGSDVGAAPLV